MVIIQQLLKIQAAFESQILAKPNVVGVAVGLKESHGVWTDEMALVALVQQKLPLSALSASDRIPSRIDNVTTDVYEVGALRALQSLPAPTGRFRPTIPGGVSAGHYAITAGTLGAVVKDRMTGEKLLLSNNHVFANSNDAQVGDVILQPGPADGGMNPADAVGRLERFVPLRYIEDANDPLPDNPGGGNGGGTTPTPTPAGCNSAVSAMVALTNMVARATGSNQHVVATEQSQAMVGAQAQTVHVQTTAPDNALDAALAKPNDPQMFSNELRHIGNINGTKAPQIGMTVRKAGRTTDYTQGMVTLLNATVNVGYTTLRGPRTARFTGQVIAQAMSQGGDSGSLVVDAAEQRAVGLLFAGSSVATIFTPIDVVLAALNVTF